MNKFCNRNFSLCFYIFLSCFFAVPTLVFSCTIVSAIGADGQVWNANNEDGPFGVANFINVFPKTDNAKYGYYTLSYYSPKFGQGGSMQGGMNEAGLTFDFNAIKRVKDFDPTSKKAFPQGDDAILPHILANMSSVQEVMDFFSTYWFQNGFWAAQMHVADRQGRFAIISASGMKLVEKGEPLVSTNFDICGNEDGSSCWRYPIATSKLSAQEVNLSTMLSICLETAQKKWLTMYSNIQNLTTGDLWFFSQHDPNVIVNTNINEILAKGRKSYTFSDLKSLIEDRPAYSWLKPDRIEVADSVKANYTGNYHNSFTGNIIIKSHPEGIEIVPEGGDPAVFLPQATNKYFFPDEDAVLEFTFDEEANRMAINLYENGYWTFRGWKTREE